MRLSARNMARFAGWTGCAGLLIVLILAGRGLLFSTFMVYDDEGFVLISLRTFFTHGALYDEVYTQYGPFFFLWHKTLGLLGGWEWNNTTGRWLTLAYWLGITLLSADTVRQLTRNLPAVAVTLAGTFCYLWVMTHEPSHPGGMIGFGVAMLAWIGVRFDPARLAGAGAAMAVIATAMAFSKINTGLFALLALWGWLMAHSRSSRTGRWLAAVTAGLFLLAPAVVMNGLLGEAWVRDFAIVVVLALIALIAVLARHTQPTPNIANSWWAAVIAGAVTTILVIGFMLLAGTSPSGLLHGVLLDPLRHPGIYTFAFVWRPGSLLVAVAALIAVVTLCRQPDHAAARWGVIGLRIAAAVGMALSALKLFPVSMPAFGLTYGVSLAAVCALPLRGESAQGGRSWLALLLIWQSLHAYPVCGSQLNWGTFLWVPLLVVSVVATLRAMPESANRIRLQRGSAVIAWGVAIAASFLLFDVARRNHRQGDALALPGAESIVVPSHTAFPIRWMAENARENTDVLFTFTGAYSFNLWTGLPTPTLANATHWFSLLNDTQQAEIIAQLEAAPRAGVIAQLNTIRFLLDQGTSVDSPLTSYLVANFENKLEIDDYALWVPKGQSFTPVNVARWRDERTAVFSLRSPVPAPAKVEFWRYDGDLRIPLAALGAEAFALTHASAASPDDPSSYTLSLPGEVPPALRDSLLFIKAADDTELAVIRVLP